MAEYFKNFDRNKMYGNVQEAEEKPKKFVFQIYPENIDYVDSLTYEEKHELINQLIASYREGLFTEDNSESSTKKFKKTLISIISVLIVIPILLYFLNVSLNVTKTNYRIFQGNFAKLFKDNNLP